MNVVQLVSSYFIFQRLSLVSGLKSLFRALFRLFENRVVNFLTIATDYFTNLT